MSTVKQILTCEHTSGPGLQICQKIIFDTFAADVVLGRVQLLDSKFFVAVEDEPKLIAFCKILVNPVDLESIDEDKVDELFREIQRLIIIDRGNQLFDENSTEYGKTIDSAILLLESGMEPQPEVAIDINAHYTVHVFSDKNERKENVSRNMFDFIQETKIEVRMTGANTFHGLQILQSPLLSEAYKSPSRSCLYKLKNGAIMIISVVAKHQTKSTESSLGIQNDVIPIKDDQLTKSLASQHAEMSKM